MANNAMSISDVKAEISRLEDDSYQRQPNPKSVKKGFKIGGKATSNPSKTGTLKGPK